MHRRTKKNFLIMFFKRFAKRAPVIFRRQQKKITRLFRIFKKNILKPFGKYLSRKYATIKNPILLTRLATILVIISMIGGFGYRVFATPPTSPYTAGETLNPNCGPTDTNCTVSGGLTGSGTVGYLSRWNGSSSTGNSVIYDDGTNIGIGTTSPGYNLHVSGNARIETGSGKYMTFGLTGNGNGITAMLSGNSEDIIGISSFNTYLNRGKIYLYGYSSIEGYYNAERGNFLFKNEDTGTELMYLSPLGKLGIGTTTPEYLLDVNGDSQFKNIEFKTHNTYDIGATRSPRNIYASGSVVGSSSVSVGSSGTIGFASRSFLKSSANGLLELLNNDSSGFSRLNFGGTSSSFPALAVNGSDLQVIRADGSTNANLFVTGSVGVGTATPEVKLDVRTGADGQIAYFIGGSQHGIVVGNDTGVSTGYLSSTTSNTALGFGINGEYDTWHIATNRNVGIQTTSPTSNLQVAQGLLGSGTVTISGGSPTTVTGTNTQFLNTFKVGDTISVTTTSGSETKTISAIASNTSLTVGSSFSGTTSGAGYTLEGGTRFVVKGNGNVGIGTASPEYKLTVAGVIAPTSTGYDLGISTAPWDTLHTTSIRGDGGSFTLDSTGNNAILADAGDLGSGTGVILRSRGLDVAQFGYNGSAYVGIGTQTPSSKLDITTASLGTTQTTTSGLALVNTTAAADGAQQISPAIRWSAKGWKTDATAGSQAVDFRSYVVPVQGTANPSGYLTFESSINGGAYTANQLTLSSSGNMGIGTAPSEFDKLLVNGNIRSSGAFATEGLYAGFGTTGYGFVFGSANGSGGSRIYLYQEAHATLPEGLQIFNGSIVNTTFYDGKVGIGTAGPSYTLQVGNSSVSGIVARFENSAGTCDINPLTTSLSCSSDIRKKKNITSLDDPASILSASDYYDPEKMSIRLGVYDTTTVLNKILAITPVAYNWNSESDTDAKHIGFIAQEIEKVFPDLVSTDPQTDFKSLNYIGFTPYIIKSIQELNLKIEGIDSVLKSQAGVIAMMSDFINGVVLQVSGGVGYLKDVAVETLKIGSPEKRTGIIFYDETDGTPYCFSIIDGKPTATKAESGECSVIEITPPSDEEGDTSNTGGGASGDGNDASGNSDALPPDDTVVTDPLPPVVVPPSDEEQIISSDDTTSNENDTPPETQIP